MPKRSFKKILRKEKKHEKEQNPHASFGIAKYDTCAKFQGKILNLILVETPGSFSFLNKTHGFSKKQVFVKNLSPVFLLLILLFFLKYFFF